MFIATKYNTDHDSLNCDTPVLMNDQPIARVRSFNCVGVKLDENLKWEEYVEMICNKAGSGIGAMTRTKKYVSINSLHTIYGALI